MTTHLDFLYTHYVKGLFRQTNKLHLPIISTPDNVEATYDVPFFAEIMEIIIYITHVLRMTF